MVVSAALGWILSGNDATAFVAGRAASFAAFTLAAWVLFVAVVVDFDRWVESVRPYPKRVVRRWLARIARRVARVLAWALACYAAVMTWLWSAAGRGLAWVLARAGEGLTLLWSWLVLVGAGVLVRYRATVGWLWSAAGRGLAWVLARAGEALTWLWSALVLVGAGVVVRYRVAMGWLWSAAGRALAWLLARLGAVLTWLWSLIARAGAAFFVLCGLVIIRLWWSAFGREDDAPPTPLRRWYVSAVDSAFGIPPEEHSVNAVRGRRAARAQTSTDRPPTQRPARRRGGGALGARDATRTTPEPAPTSTSRRQYVGRQVTRRQQRGKPEELLAAALARLRSARGRAPDREDGR
jgi:hypothetical protein